MKPVKKLTKREEQIMRMIADEKTSVEIAKILSLSIRTIDTHRKNIATKMKTSNPVTYTKYAIEQGWVKGYKKID